MFKIRPLTANELPLLWNFAPPDWNTDLAKIFSFHFGQPSFYSIGAELDGKLVGCANGLLQDRVGWLGNIIVLPEARRSGIGQALTEHLIQYFQMRGCRAQLLIATSMGEGLYKKLDFRICSYYISLRSEQTPQPSLSRRIRPLVPADVEAVLELDQQVCSEERAPFLRRFLQGAFVYEDTSSTIDGYLLPALGNGLIIARGKRAGLALLKFKLAYGSPLMVVPEENRAALDLLQQAGYFETKRMPRMCLGEQVDWKPELVFSRGTGFCG